MVVSKKNEWVAARESILTKFHSDHTKMMQVMKAGFPKPVLDRMNEDIKVTESISSCTDSCCFLITLLSASDILWLHQERLRVCCLGVVMLPKRFYVLYRERLRI